MLIQHCIFIRRSVKGEELKFETEFRFNDQASKGFIAKVGIDREWQSWGPNSDEWTPSPIHSSSLPIPRLVLEMGRFRGHGHGMTWLSAHADGEIQGRIDRPVAFFPQWQCQGRAVALSVNAPFILFLLF